MDDHDRVSIPNVSVKDNLCTIVGGQANRFRPHTVLGGFGRPRLTSECNDQKKNRSHDSQNEKGAFIVAL